MKNAARILGVAAIVATLLSCGSPELTRDKALTIIAESFATDITGVLKKRELRASERSVVAPWIGREILQELAGDGLITIREYGSEWYLVEVTQAGLDTGLVTVSGDRIHVVSCRAVLDRVTGIRQISETSAVADYEWHSADLSPFWKVTMRAPVDPQRTCLRAGLAKTASKEFALYDDGWRAIEY